MKKVLTIVMGLLVLVSLSSCGIGKTNGSSAADKNKKIATADAKTILSYVYEGNKSGASDVLTESSSEMKSDVIAKLKEKQTTALVKNNNIDDYRLVVDGSIYSASEIISDYADAYYKQIETIGSVKVKSVSVSGDKATVKAEFNPIAGLSEAHPIGEARTTIFGGLDNDTIVRESQNKDVKTIQKMITLKLYSVYYGDMAKQAQKSSTPQIVTFSLKKDGEHYKADRDTILELSKKSRANVYSDSKDDKSGTTGDSEASSSI